MDFEKLWEPTKKELRNIGVKPFQMTAIKSLFKLFYNARLSVEEVLAVLKSNYEDASLTIGLKGHWVIDIDEPEEKYGTIDGLSIKALREALNKLKGE